MYAFLFLITKYSYVGIFMALGLGIVGLPIPDESLIAFTGFLSSQGKLNFALLLPVIILVTLGLFLLLYLRNRNIKDM